MDQITRPAWYRLFITLGGLLLAVTTTPAQGQIPPPPRPPGMGGGIAGRPGGISGGGISGVSGAGIAGRPGGISGQPGISGAGGGFPNRPGGISGQPGITGQPGISGGGIAGRPGGISGQPGISGNGFPQRPGSISGGQMHGNMQGFVPPNHGIHGQGQDGNWGRSSQYPQRPYVAPPSHGPSWGGWSTLGGWEDYVLYVAFGFVALALLLGGVVALLTMLNRKAIREMELEYEG